MKILVATALFPPDIADPAPYLKELVERLSHDHSLSVLCYGTYPEAVAGVEFSVVKKNLPAVFRVPLFTYSLWRQARRHDVVLLQNGPSTELPGLIISLIFPLVFVLHMSDAKVRYQGMLRSVHKLLRRRVALVITTAGGKGDATFVASPLPRPEILPFTPQAPGAHAAYEASWQKHLADLTTLIHYRHD